MVDDYRALVMDWGFALEDVATPVRLWQGEQDALVPMAEARGSSTTGSRRRR